MHPLLALITSRPQLLADHAEAYGELVSAEMARVSKAWKTQALLNAAALAGLAVAVMLAGVALMLWAVVPPTSLREPWLLIAVPLLPLAAATGCLMAARRRVEPGAFDSVREHVKADLMMLREAVA